MSTSNRLLPQGVSDVLAQVIVPTLHRQRWSFDGPPGAAMARMIHLSCGRGELSHKDGDIALDTPDVVWLPAGLASSLRLEAGSAGICIGISDSLLVAAIGGQADSAALQLISSRLCRFTPHEGDPKDELLRSLTAIEIEARQEIGASRPYLVAHLTIALVLLLRMADRRLEAQQAPERVAPQLRRFRHLVEAQFRDHWPISRYAAELAMSPDRLHDLCLRTLGRAPITLLHQRLVREACMMLAVSDLSVGQLASDLGFADAAHFSRFFKRWMGVGPKSYRIQLRGASATGSVALPASYADWP